MGFKHKPHLCINGENDNVGDTNLETFLIIGIYSVNVRTKIQCLHN